MDYGLAGWAGRRGHIGGHGRLKGVSPSAYLIVMLLVIVVSFAIAVPSLLLKKCPRCGARNGLDARSCRNCQAPFADAEP